MLWKHQKRATRKQSFLLFELLLSMGLLTLCVFPLVNTHAKLVEAERAHIQAFQREQEVQEVFFTIKTQLYEHAYPWEKLMHGVKEPTYSLKKRVQSTKRNSSESGLVLNANLHFGKDSYKRTIYVEKAYPYSH